MQAIKGTSDPQWKALVDSLVQPASSYTEEKVSRLFSAFSRMDSTAAVPAFVPIGLFAVSRPYPAWPASVPTRLWLSQPASLLQHRDSHLLLARTCQTGNLRIEANPCGCKIACCQMTAFPDSNDNGALFVMPALCDLQPC